MPSDIREIGNCRSVELVGNAAGEEDLVIVLGDVLLIYEDNILGKDMEPADIVRAITKLLASGIPIANEMHVLNQWR